MEQRSKKFKLISILLVLSIFSMGFSAPVPLQIFGSILEQIMEGESRQEVQDQEEEEAYAREYDTRFLNEFPMIEKIPADDSPEDYIALSTGKSSFHMVGKGDSLWKIAERYYGSGKEWKQVREANKEILKGTTTLIAGEKLTVPEKKYIKKRGSSHSAYQDVKILWHVAENRLGQNGFSDNWQEVMNQIKQASLILGEQATWPP